MKIKELQLLLIIIFLGSTFRFFGLYQRDFWFDEAFTYHIAKLPIHDLIQAVISDNNPPFYYLFIHFLLKIGKDEIILRLPSLLAGILVIPLIWQLGTIIHKKNAGIIAAAIFAVSPLTIYIASEARLHSFGMLFATTSVFLFIMLCKKHSLITIITFIIINILGIYTHYYLALLFFPYTFIVLRDKQNNSFKIWAIICVIIAFCFLPWITFSVFLVHNPCYCPNTILSLPAAIVSPAIGGIGNVTLRSFPQLPIFKLILFLTAVAFIVFFFIKGVSKLGIIVFIYSIPVMILSVAGLFLPVFSPKGIAIFSPLYFFITATGFEKSKRKIIITIISLVAIVSVIQLTDPFFSGDRLKQMYEITSKKNVPVLHTSILTYYSFSYYSDGNQRQVLITNNPLSKSTVGYIGGEKKPIPNISSLWLVENQKSPDDKNYKNLYKKLKESYLIEKNYSVSPISIKYFKRK